jgi:hypothetical protein
MPEKEPLERAREDAREGKSPSTQAGEFVREEIHHIREGKHGARSTKQAIAIGLSKARRSGVKLGTPKKASAKARDQATRDSRRGRSKSRRRTSRTRSQAVSAALRREERGAASKRSLSRQARSSAKKRGPAARRGAALKAVRTRQRRGTAVRKAA